MPTKEIGKSASYWDKRRLLKYKENEKKSKKYINSIQSLYNKANKDIDNMLYDVYKNYSKDTGLNIQELKQLLTKSETKKTWQELQAKGLDQYVKDNYKSRITRLEQIRAQVYERAKDIYSQEQLKQTELYKHVVYDSYYKTIYNVQKGTGIGFDFNKIDDNIMNTLLNDKWSGKNYSKRIWENTDTLATEISKIIGGSLISGRGVEVTTREIRDRFNVAKYYAERLVRTEMNYYDNQADMLAYEEMGVDEYVLVATLDSRTSAYCIEIDGKHFPYSKISVGENYPPFHPNCRCTTRGYLGKKVEKGLVRRARNPITGKNEVIGNVSYNEWAKRFGLSANNKNNTISSHPRPKLLGNIDVKNTNKINKVIKHYENIIKNDTIENAIVITKDGEIYQCFGNKNSVWVDIDLGDKLNGAIVTHNHPKDETYFGFSQKDISLFEKFNLKKLRGIDYKYTYEFDRTRKSVLKQPTFKDKDIGFEHIFAIKYAIDNNIYYMRWKND